jgi:predicted acylesterase/phospholipase RssA
LELFRKVLLASASIPGDFPPQIFTVTAGGQEFQEMHVDGGVRVEILLYEDALEPFTVDVQRERKLYIIRNDQVYPEWEYVKPRLRNIAHRAINSLLKSQGVGDIYRLYVYAQRDGVDFNLAYIPPNFPPKSRIEFDKAHMNKLFDHAYNKAKNGYPWHKHPPFFKPSIIGASGQR